MKFSMKSGSIVIDGKSYTGNSVIIKNGNVTIDGIQKDQEISGPINVTVNGDITHLENSFGDISANNIGDLKTVSGNVTCGNVTGNVKTVGGDVECGIVGGNIKTVGGNISHR